jgi:hypothetical protein
MCHLLSFPKKGRLVLMAGALFAVGAPGLAQQAPRLPTAPLVPCPVRSPGIPAYMPDLSVSVSTVWPETTWDRVTFTVTLSPGLYPPPGSQKVEVSVFQTPAWSAPDGWVGGVTFALPLTGGSVTKTVEWTAPPFEGPYLINVVIDPDNKIRERNECNNRVSVPVYYLH